MLAGCAAVTVAGLNTGIPKTDSGVLYTTVNILNVVVPVLFVQAMVA